MNLKKLVSCSIAILTFSLTALLSQPQFTIKAGSDAILYNSAYEEVPLTTPIDNNGYIVKTANKQVELISDFAEVYIKPNSIFTITNFDTTNPSVYLVSGQMNVYILYPQDVTITCYTPTSLVHIKNAGEYVIQSSERYERVYNFSEEAVDVYDSIRRKQFNTDSYTYIDFTTGSTNIFVDEIDYLQTSIFSNEVSNLAKAKEFQTVPEITLTKVETAVEKEIKTPEILPIVVAPDKKPNEPKLSVKTEKLPPPPVFASTSTAKITPIKKPKQPELTVEVTPVEEAPTSPNFVTTTVDGVAILNKVIAPPKVTAIYGKLINAPTIKNVTTVEIPLAPVETASKTTKVISKNTSVNSPFKLYLSSSLTLDDKKGSRPSFAIMPVFNNGIFNARFNFDLFHIYNYPNIEKDFKSQFNYFSRFIDRISYNSLNEKFSLSLSRFEKNIYYDPLMIFFPENAAYDSTNSKLSLTHFLKSKYFNQNLTFDDLSFDSNVIKGSYFATFQASKNWDFAINLGLNALANNEDLTKGFITPEVNLSIPFYSTESFEIKTSLTAATFIDFNSNPEIGNSIIALSIPMKIHGLDLELGGSYNFGLLHQGFITPSYGYTASDLNLNLKSSYENKYFNYRVNLLLPLDLKEVKTLKGQEYIDTALGFKFANFNLDLGFRSQGLLSNIEQAFLNTTDYYATLSYSNTDFETGLSFINSNNVYNLKIFNIIKNFAYNDFAAVSRTDSKIFNFGVDLAYQTQLADFGTISLLPFLELGNEKYNLTLQVPVAVKLDNFTFEFSSYDNLIYDFGRSKNTELEKAFDILNDATGFIKKLVLGDSTTAFHLYMLRDYKFDKSSNLVDFNKYSFRDNLTTVLGTKFGNYGVLDFIAPNLSKPNLVVGNLKMYPSGKTQDYDVDLNMPVQFLLKQNNLYDININPFLKFTVYLGPTSFNLLFTSPVNINTLSGTTDFKQFLFATNQRRFTFGGGFKVDFSNSSIETNFGTYQGRNDYEYFNPFYEMMGYNFESQTSQFTTYDNQFKYYADLAYTLRKDAHSLQLSYRVDNLVDYLDKDFASDILNFDYSYILDKTTNLSLGFYLAGVKYQIANLEFEKSLLSSNTLAYLKIKKNFNYYELGIQLNYAPQVNEYDTSYINSFSSLSNSVISISTYATLRY